jgi:hypothetical protein
MEIIRQGLVPLTPHEQSFGGGSKLTHHGLNASQQYESFNKSRTNRQYVISSQRSMGHGVPPDDTEVVS